MSTVQKFGVENLKHAVKFSLDLAADVAEAGKDGFNWKDSFGLLSKVGELTDILKNKDAIVAEIGELNTAEREDLNNYVKSLDFNVADDKIETIVTEAVNIIFGVFVIVGAIKAKPETATPQS